MCVLYCGRLVPTVLRKAETRVPRQDLESLVESNGRIGLHGDASLRKYVELRRRDRKLASSKIASEANLSRARGTRELRGKKNRLRNKLNW